jgi:hypothetical protein
MVDPVFLFFGYGVEYSLHDLCQYLVEAGESCVEIDMLDYPDVEGALRALEGRRLVLVTSAHFLHDRFNLCFERPGCKIVSLLHVISTLRPERSIYYPHDLKDPVRGEELPYLPLFDLFLSPLPQLQALETYLPVKQVGWIKRVPKQARIMPEDFNPGGAVFFPGNYEYYLKQGLDRFYDDYRPLFDTGAAVKLPYWHENSGFEEFLRERGVKVYPSKANSLHVMEENETVFTQALSSICIEACGLGKKVCYIRNSIFDYKEPAAEFRGAGNIVFIDSPVIAGALRTSLLPSNRLTLDYFDFPGARAAILDVVRNGAAAGPGTAAASAEDS